MRNIFPTKIIALFSLLLLFVSAQMSAHHLWIESAAQGQVGKSQKINIYFGEFEENKREEKGKVLDAQIGLQAWIIAPNGEKTELKLNQEQNSFETSFTPTQQGQYTVYVNNENKALSEKYKASTARIRSVLTASRSIVVGQAQALKSNHLEGLYVSEVPNAEPNKRSFLILFDGKPLDNTKVLLTANKNNRQSFTTTADGLATFSLNEKLPYVIEVGHSQSKVGTHLGKPYDTVKHKHCLSF